ncbi:MAG: hypothetical protein IJX88_01455 [Clostridia bacterium]|nr:hypothetical protein [Clostridia bacterium]
MAAVKKKKIVFVCTGNTCRSPMAEMLLRDTIERLKIKNVTVSSAGIKAKSGDLMNPKSLQTLTAKGIPVTEFAAKKLDKRTLKDAFAIVCMTDGQRDLLMETRWQALRKAGVEGEFENTVYSFSELAGYEILDPYGRDLDCYSYVFELLAGGMSAVLNKLLPENLREYRAEKSKKRASAPRKKKSATP